MDNNLAELLRRLYGLGGQYVRDAMPGGSLNPEWTPEKIQTAGEVASITPTPIGDIASGMLAVDDIRKGNYGDAAMNAIGIIPGVPAMAGVVHPKLLELGIPDKAVAAFKKFTEVGRRPFVTTDPYAASVGDKAAYTRAFNQMAKALDEAGVENHGRAMQQMRSIMDYEGMDALK